MVRILILVVLIPPISHVTVSATENAAPVLEQQELFRAGVRGYQLFRIPSLVVTKRGTILAFAEGRNAPPRDFGNNDLTMRRSFDGGRNWTEIEVIADGGALTMGNPCPVVDHATGTIWMLFCRGSEPGRGNAEVLVMKSTDDGEHWSRPYNISRMTKDPAWPYVFTGPGHGIQLKTGRLLVPAAADLYQRVGETQFSYCFYSDDHGASWKLGKPLKHNACDECDVVELVDGTIYLTGRPRKQRLRAYAFSKDGGHSWSEVEYETSQPTSDCDGAVIRLTDTSRFRKNRVLVSCPANTNARTHMTIHLSYDECRTWPVSKLINAGSSRYSDLAVAADNTILCLYEAEQEYITLARFTIEWLTDGADTIQRKARH